MATSAAYGEGKNRELSILFSGSHTERRRVIHYIRSLATVTLGAEGLDIPDPVLTAHRYGDNVISGQGDLRLASSTARTGELVHMAQKFKSLFAVKTLFLMVLMPFLLAVMPLVFGTFHYYTPPRPSKSA